MTFAAMWRARNSLNYISQNSKPKTHLLTGTSSSRAEGQSGKSSRTEVPLRDQLRAEWVGVYKFCQGFLCWQTVPSWLSIPLLSYVSASVPWPCKYHNVLTGCIRCLSLDPEGKSHLCVYVRTKDNMGPWPPDVLMHFFWNRAFGLSRSEPEK